MCATWEGTRHVWTCVQPDCNGVNHVYRVLPLEDRDAST